MSKVILHIDLNAFFVRCEEILDPTLEGKPVIIGHSGRGGIVSTCSYAARKYGVKSGMPTYKAQQLCKNAVLIGGHYELYSAKSKEFINFVKKYSTIIEQASIDECYVDMTKVLQKEKEPLKFVQQMQASLYKETGLKCSIGIAPTKFLAKMGSDMKKPMGITVIRRRDVRKMLDPLPIEDFFGIGKKTSPRLREMGINTIGDLEKLINSDDQDIKKFLGKFYFGIKEWINGYGSDVVDTEPWDPKQIGHSTTLPRDALDIDEIKIYLKQMAEEVSKDAKAENKVGSSVQLILKDNEFKVINRSKRVQNKTNDFEIIYNEGLKLLIANYDGRPIRLVGITLQNLINKDEIVEQLSIFDNYEEVKEQNAIKLLIAELNRQMKGTTFKTAGDYLKEKKDATH
ncbi:MAG: DNA polymerase IV [Firmicutes bacterium]|nr:DNA polymerase IV [Candidatus Fiminaster equi]